MNFGKEVLSDRDGGGRDEERDGGEVRSPGTEQVYK